MSKNIVICCDGTGQYGRAQHYTNVARLFTILDLTDPGRQIACYDPGVGTKVKGEVSDAVRSRERELGFAPVPAVAPSSALTLRVLRWTHLEVLAGLAVGTGLFENVREMYEFLIDHYEPDDRIFLFGFSRGAFTVRVLAGLLHRCGLLLPEHRGHYARAFKLYEPHLEGLPADERKRCEEETADFKAAYARECEIWFLGIWDTVKSVGYFKPVSMPHTRRNPSVRTVRHALSIDESRSFFVPTTWGGLDNDTEPPLEGQCVQEVWFAGGHADVGGGYKDAESDIARISLRWMIKAAKEAKGEWPHGLLIDEKLFGKMFPPDAAPRLRTHNELTAFSWLTPLWRLSEFFPRKELQNDPPPPRRLRKWKPSGPRPMATFGREGVVLVDSRAKAVYRWNAPPLSDLYPEGKPKLKALLLGEKDLKDTEGETLIHCLRDAPDPLSQYLRSRFPVALQQRLREYDDGFGTPPERLKRLKWLKPAVVKELNRLIRDERLYQEDRFAQVELTRVTKELLQQNPRGEELVLLNRWLLADAYPRKITRIAKVEFIETP